MRVPDVGHVIHRVEIAEPVVVIEVLLPAANNGERPMVRDAE
jgi:hypothetical protein